MKKPLVWLSLIAGMAMVLGGSSFIVRAQARSSATRYEYAIVRWEEPDRLLYNYPNNQFQSVSVQKTGQNIPKDSSNEEYCLTTACNFMAKSGWEPLNLNSQRVLFRRSVN